MLKTKGFDQESMAKAHAKHFTGGPMAALRIILASDKSAGYEAQMDRLSVPWATTRSAITEITAAS
jgi:hypothetical protein